MEKYIEENMKLYKYDYTEISFNIEDVCFSIYSFHNRNNSLLFNSELSQSSEAVQSAFHHHPYFEFFFCRNGEATVNFENDTVTLNKFDILLVSPKTVHTSLDGKNNTGALNFLFKQNSLKTENGLYKILLKAFSAPYIHMKNCRKFADTLRGLMSNIDNGNKFMISRFFYQIITDLLGEIGMLTSISPEEMLKDSSISRYRKIDYLIRYAHKNEDFSLKFLADSLNLSERQTSRIIKEEFGCTFSEILTRARMKSAVKYLSNKKMTIAEVSAMVGYDSINCFYNAFKKQFGCLPGQYRKNFLNNNGL